MVMTAPGMSFDQPLGEMNTTPLIDVMPVLLVMFILAVPAAVNQVPVDLPSAAHPDWPIIKPERNLVTIDAGSTLRWNGQPVSREQLGGHLTAARHLRPEPELQFEPDPAAPYDAAAWVLNVIKSSGITAFGFVGNDRYAMLSKAAARR